MVERECAAGCDEPTATPMKRCSRCHKAWYCDERCQKQHWPSHVFDCKPDEPISTVYHLARACWRDFIPLDPQTRIDYGFEKASRELGGEAESYLLGLYQGVFKVLGVECKEVRRWQKEGRLVEGIKAAYLKSPHWTRGSYYDWMLQHENILDGTPVDEDQAEALTEATVASLAHAGWVLSGGDPTDSREVIHAKIAALPSHAQACHAFYQLVASKMYPSPNDPSWLDFGFVAASSQGEELGYSRAYQTLVKLCTFDEFCTAYNSSTIPALLDHYNVPLPSSLLFHNADSPPCFFRDVMANSPHGCKSVWDLKQYIDRLTINQPDTVKPAPVRPVMVDYGFANCKTEAERKMLDDLYTQLFAKMESGMDPLELHAACLRGALVEHARRFVKLAPYTAKYTRLLKNPYPLRVPEPEGC